MSGFLLIAGLTAIVFMWLKRSGKIFHATGASSSIWQELIQQHGLHLDQQYRNIIGLDTNAQKMLIYSAGKPFVLNTYDVTGVETNWNTVTTRNGWGMIRQKDTHNRLFIKTRSMTDPRVEVRFHSKEEMDNWYQRLSVMFNLR
ncbi:hypothetical protein HFRIS_001215 [Herbaspirillum frisingense GSF30]|uniref:Uncharacterized protein n=1 Tax=Herbaspirillum frisingense GSF30 TaxID=864073 RepID=A0AAI9IIV7_9BURK|nr:hypothetical protein [Herbaspirillum frisingense]EOA06889.1 hypothetical protein HFRIS_001215 [Herbaspirillum frisingense GSF30]